MRIHHASVLGDGQWMVGDYAFDTDAVHNVVHEAFCCTRFYVTTTLMCTMFVPCNLSTFIV